MVKRSEGKKVFHGAGKRLEWRAYCNKLGKDDRIEVSYQSDNGKVKKFSVCYLHRINGEWFTVKRCDNSHQEKKETPEEEY
jgi:hypothetical protein